MLPQNKILRFVMFQLSFEYSYVHVVNDVGVGLVGFVVSVDVGGCCHRTVLTLVGQERQWVVVVVVVDYVVFLVVL